MKSIKTLTLLLTFFIISTNSEAQFWKKLGKKVEEAAKETVNRKAEEKASEKTEQAIDSLFNVDKKIKRKKKKKNQNPNSTNESEEASVNENILEDYLQQDEDIDLPESYSFDWKYVMKIESEATKKKQKEIGDMNFTYLLSTQSTAFATQFDMGNKGKGMSNTLMVMDLTAGINFTLMEINGEKVIQKMPSMANMSSENNETENNLDNTTIKKIGTKVILGYTCQGFEIQLEEGISRVYINPNAPVSFNHSGDSKFAPKGFKQEWLNEFKNGLMMEMTFTSSNKPKNNMKMTCIELVKEPTTIYLNEYKSLMEMGRE
ncbi:DUF4412 domain-containing protein [Aureibaculum sp. A20]|uniref:DUF4412 domain-containing protein n=1 Tax=Aureibaculum flavum TaxID=2795986 RepID=A0ABS0WPR6_9FLAO|nr:DUF4412 domain-containing protein [Aureibaculum flavum]MBJ2173975.1 DUF4412 domain-containing protein [Aureibaculum flavum]